MLMRCEARLVALWDQGEINSLIHFDGSMDGHLEDWMCRFYSDNIKRSDWVLASHRAHYIARLHAFTEDELVASCLRGRSMFNYAPRFIQSAIVGGLCGIAAGIAMSIKRRGGSEKVWMFGGDGMEDQGQFYEAVRLVDGRDLPCMFVILDNNRQCGVSKEQRKVRSFDWPSCVVRCSYTARWPHAGTNSRPNLKSQEPPK